MSDHPSSDLLEALAAGDELPEIREHVARCGDCAHYLSTLEAELETWRSENPLERAEQAVDRAQKAKHSAEKTARVRVLRIASLVSAPILAAAAILLFLRSVPHAGPVGSETTSKPGVIATGGDTRFKGAAPQLAVIVEHRGSQRRSTDEAVVSRGDRLRIEVSVPADTSIAGGILTRDRRYLPLILPGELRAGTHFSEKAAGFDAEPTEGWVIVGSPQAIETARTTGQLDTVVALPLRYTADQ